MKTPKSAADIADASNPNNRKYLHPMNVAFVDSFAVTYIVSVIAACTAELVTYPLDLTKTRLQVQGEIASEKSAKQKMKYRGMMATAIGIAREEGPLELWRGLSPVLYKHAIYSGLRITCYDFIRKKITGNEPGTAVRPLPIWQAALVGATAGAVAQWFASPADLVKVQIQMEGRRRLMGEPPRVLGPGHAFREIFRRGGIKGLWKGSIPNIQRAALVNLGDLSAYDVSKHMIMEKFDMPDCRTVHFLASLCAGFVAAVVSTPVDVLKTRIMNQPTDEQGRGLLYKGSVDCLRQSVANEGFLALYKGFLPCWIRLGPWALTFWVTFEQIKKLLGASGY